MLGCNCVSVCGYLSVNALQTVQCTANCTMFYLLKGLLYSVQFVCVYLVVSIESIFADILFTCVYFSG